MPFDEQQQMAIDAIHTNVIVRASAGAGKTGVLVARLVKRCVSDRVPVTRILASTFTEAAASEMKKRLAKELHDRFEKETDPERKAYLKEQLANLSTADITTIDSYCLKIIKKYYNVIGLDPALCNHILSEGEEEALRKQAFHSVMKQYAETDHDNLLALLESLFPAPQDFDGLYKVCKKINAHADAAIDPEAWYEKAAASYAKVKCFAGFPEDIKRAYLSRFINSMDRVIADLDLMASKADESQKIKPDLILAKKNAAITCRKELEEGNYSSFCMRLDAMALLKTSTGKEVEEYAEARDEVNAEIKKMLAERYEESVLIHDSNDLDAICRTLVSFARDCNEAFLHLRQKNACMNFSDMERYALEILMKNDGQCAEIIRDSLDEIMIDEFQDTSELQNHIIELIAKKDNVFRVGDVKQSIYRFRQAKPQLMRSLMQDPDTRVITLRHNYRSRKSIVAFTNMLFRNLMNIPGCQDAYLAEDDVTIGATYQEEEPVPVVFTLLPIAKNPDETEDSDEEAPDAKSAKAAWIASEISRMVKEEHLSYHDFAVLVKGHADKVYLRYAFDQCGIPYDIDAREGFYQSRLCQFVIALCRFMMNPQDRVALACILTSSFFQCSDEDLAAMKLAGGSLKKGCELLHPEYLKEINEMHLTASTNGIQDFLGDLAGRHAFYEHLEEREKSNFDYLFEITCQRKISALPEFLDMINDSENEKSSEAVSTGKDDDVVTVTTIHHSKGLQYGYVFLWGTSRNMFMDARDPVLVDDDLYIGLNHSDLPYRIVRESMRRKAIRVKQSQEDIEEFTRLIYVAITRAEKRLFIVDAIDRTKKVPYYRHMTLPDIQKRPGISGLILEAACQGPYFRVVEEEIPQLSWSSAVEKQYVHALPYWTGPIPQAVSTLTPSSTETTSLPELDPSVENTDAMAYGTRMHETMEKLPDRVWTREDLEPFALSRGDQDRILAFGNSALYQECLSLGEIHKEYPFWINTGTVHMNGQMDFCAIGKNKAILVDFKTDNADPEEIKKRYSTQLNAYRLALHTITGLPVEAYAWSFHNSAAILIPEETVIS